MTNVETDANPYSSLINKLGVLGQSSRPEEVENYKLLLCMAAGGLAPRGNEPSTPQKVAAFGSVVDCLRALGLRGSPWVGRPDFMTDDLLRELQAESSAVHSVAKLTDRYLLGFGGPVVERFARSDVLVDLVRASYPDVTPTGIASYIYYDDPGHGLDPHVDTETYAVNAILMLKHEFASDPAALLLYEEGVSPRRILMSPGQMAVINAGSVVHAREDMKAGERVHIVTIGFQ